MNLGTHPARVVAAVAAVIAAGTTTVMALTVGTASADEPGRCTQNVNVREEPDATSRIVAMCDEGTAVMLGAERDHFVWLDKLHGWASKDFVKPDETAAGTDAADAGDPSDAASSDDAASGDRDGAHRADNADADGADAQGADGPDAQDADHESADGQHAASSPQSDGENAGSRDGADATPAAAPAHRRAGGLAGLLGG